MTPAEIRNAYGLVKCRRLMDAPDPLWRAIGTFGPGFTRAGDTGTGEAIRRERERERD